MNEMERKNPFPLSQSSIKELNPEQVKMERTYLGGASRAAILELDGVKYYAKEYVNAEQAQCEFIANQLYKEFGVPVLDGQLFKIKNKIYYATPLIEYARHFEWEWKSATRHLIDPATKQSPNENHQHILYSMYLPAAWLLDWDAVGTGDKPFGNILVVDDDNLVLIDHGGSLLWRGFQGRKSAKDLNEYLTELDIFSDPRGINPSMGATFSEITEEEVLESAVKLQNIPDEKIRAIVQSAGLDTQTTQYLTNLLLKRKENIIKNDYFKTTN